MITSRRVEEKDRIVIEQALAQDAFHPDTKADVFYQNNMVSNVYSDSIGDVFVLRASKALRIEMIFLNNQDHARNAKAMLAGWKVLVQGAKAGGFTEIVASTNSSQLRDFAIKFLEMELVETAENHETELRKLL